MNRHNLPEKAQFTIKELMEITGYGRNKVNRLLGLGKNPVPVKIRSKKEGRNRIILFPWLVDYYDKFEKPDDE
jgi:hypothetical protein